MKTQEFYLNSWYDIQNTIQLMGIYNILDVVRIEITKCDNYSQKFLLTVFLKQP